MAALWPMRVIPAGPSFTSLTVASLPLTRTMATSLLSTSFIAKIHCNLYLEFPTQNIYKSEK